jgi:hypothetical protein
MDTFMVGMSRQDGLLILVFGDYVVGIYATMNYL